MIDALMWFAIVLGIIAGVTYAVIKSLQAGERWRQFEQDERASRHRRS